MNNSNILKELVIKLVKLKCNSYIEIKGKSFWNNLKISLICNKQFWISIILSGIITYSYFKWYIFNPGFSEVNKNQVITASLIFIFVVIILIAWVPRITHYIGTYLVVTYAMIFIVSLFFLIYFLLLLMLHINKSSTIFGILSILAVCVFIISAIIFFKKVEESILAQTTAIVSFLFLFSMPVIFIVIRSQTLAFTVGGFIAFMTHFFLKQLIPYIFSNIHAGIYNSEKIDLKYELNSMGKIIVGLIDLLFAYVALAYGIAMYITKQFLVNIKLSVKSNTYKSITSAIEKKYGDKIIPQMDLGTITHWTTKADNTLLNSFTLVMTLELVISIIIFAGIYKNFNKSIFSLMVKPKKIGKTINSHNHRHRPSAF